MKTVLDAGELALSTPYGTWTIAAKHNRAGGDVDVILARRVTPLETSLLAFRRDAGEWTQLSGAWTGLGTAIRAAAKRTKRQVFTARYLIPLLDLATLLDDFPPPEPVWLTVTEAAQLVGVSQDVIRSRIKGNLIEHRKQDGRRFEVTKASLLEAFPANGGGK